MVIMKIGGLYASWCLQKKDRRTEEEKRIDFEIALVSWICAHAPWKDEYAEVHFETACMSRNFDEALKILDALRVLPEENEAGR